MIRRALEKKGFKMTDAEFAEVMEETQRDIKANHILLGLKSNMSYILRTAIIYYKITKRVQI